MHEHLFSYNELFDFSKAILLKIGCSREDAETAVKVLLSADLRGVDSHGVARLSGYIRLWEARRVNASPDIRIIHESPSTAVVDGDAGLGLVVAPASMQIAIDKAKQVGTGWVSVQNSNHFGIAGYHAMMALEQDMIGIALTNASALVAPTFSTERLLGTNPICVAIPCGNEPAFVADLATTTAANGKIEILQRKKESAPSGWLQNSEGEGITDAHGLKTGGALLPLGSDRQRGSHKGYALGAIVDIFSGVLSGASYGPWVPPFPVYIPLPDDQPGRGVGHFFGAMRIDAFRSSEEFKKHMDHWVQRFRTAKTVAGQPRVLIPGDPERETAAYRTKHGIPLLNSVLQDLQTLATKFDVYLRI